MITMTEDEILNFIHGQLILTASTHEDADKNKVIFELMDEFKYKFRLIRETQNG
jgi:hypothetical protein